MLQLPLENITDNFSKNILENGSCDFGVLELSRPYSFVLSGNTYSTTSLNIFVHTFDSSMYPSSAGGTITGFSAYCTTNNAKALASYDGTFSISSLTSSTTSNLMNSGKFNPNSFNGDFNNVSLSTYSASVTSLYIYNFNRNVYGDKIHDATLQLFLSGSSTAFAYDTYSYNNVSLYSLSSSYVDSTSAITRIWVFCDIGKIALWSSNSSIMNSFTGINKVNFRNSLHVPNVTINLNINQDEYNLTENYSFYGQDYNNGLVPDTWFTTVGLYNPWNDLIAVAKIQKPIKKGNIPITIKMILDLL